MTAERPTGSAPRRRGRLLGILKGAGALAALVLLALALGCLVPLGPGDPPEGSAGTGPARHRVLILANAIHTDIALPVTPQILSRFAFLREAGLPMERADWILVGRGGRAFYVETPTWGDLKPGPVLRAFTRDAAVMHVGLAGPLAIEEESHALDLSDSGYESLLQAIEESFAETRAIEGAGYGPYDRFFPAKGWFNALLGCNVWTGSVLRRAGIATGLWTPLPWGLLWSLDLHNPPLG